MSSIYEDLPPVIITTAKGDSDFNTAAGGRIYQELALDNDGTPQEVFPYAVFSWVTNDPDYTYTSDYENVFFQWALFDSSRSAATMQDLVTKLWVAFDDVILTIPNWNSLRISRQTHTLIGRDIDGVRQSVTTYRVQTQKQ